MEFYNMFNNLLQNQMLLAVGAYWGGIVSILLIILFFVKSSRDERGRGIIGSASIFSTIVFIILTNFVAKSSIYIDINFISFANCLQWTYDIVLTVEIVAIFILKKIR